jgi:hypothetical protein
LAFPEGHLALIQQKTALLFWESRYLKPVWLSGAFSQRKITPNSTYWKAKVRKDVLLVEMGFKEAKKGDFGIGISPIKL